MATKIKSMKAKQATKPAANKKVMKKTRKKTVAVKKFVSPSCSCEEVDELNPIVPMLPDLPEPPQPIELGICRHCHMLPAAAFELVIVMTCLVFSLSAVLMTSTQTIERQQNVITTLQQIQTDVYARK